MQQTLGKSSKIHYGKFVICGQYLQEGNDKRPQREIGGLVKFRVKLFNGESRVLPQDQQKGCYKEFTHKINVFCNCLLPIYT